MSEPRDEEEDKAVKLLFIKSRLPAANDPGKSNRVLE